MFAGRTPDAILAGLNHLTDGASMFSKGLSTCPKLMEVNLSDNVLNAKSVAGLQNLFSN